MSLSALAYFFEKAQLNRYVFILNQNLESLAKELFKCYQENQENQENIINLNLIKMNSNFD